MRKPRENPLLICVNLSYNIRKHEVKLFDFLALRFSAHDFILITPLNVKENN